MAYRESDLLQTLEKDMVRPDLLFTKEYITNDGVTTDTERSYESVVTSYLLSHLPDLQKGMGSAAYLTKAERASEGRNRQVTSVLTEQQTFARGLLLDMAVTVKEGAGIFGRFDFSAIDRSGKKLTLFAAEPAGTKEKPLARLLRLWAWKEAVSRRTLTKELGLEGPLSLQAVLLFTGASNDRYGISARKPVSMEIKRLSAMLGVSELYLFHGTHLVPVNPGLPIPGQYEKDELLSLIERDRISPETLYQKSYMSREGITSDTGEPYVKVLADWIAANFDLWLRLQGSYRLVEGAWAERSGGNRIFPVVRKQRVFPPFGKVLGDDIEVLTGEGRQLGRPSMLLYDSFENPAGNTSILRIVETPETSDSLLTALLRLFTRMSLIDKNKLFKDLKLSPDTQLEGRILLEKDSRAADLFLRDLPYLSVLMKAMGIGLAIIERDYEALW